MGKRKLAKPPSKKEQQKTKSHLAVWIVVGVLGVALAGIIAFTLYQGGGTTAPGKRGLARAGADAPDFTLRLLSGQDITLSSLRGKPVLVNFWASG